MLMVLFDLGTDEITWKLPPLDDRHVWQVLIDSGGDPTGAEVAPPGEGDAASGAFVTDGRRVVLLAAVEAPTPS
jgi:hypothetical protein